MPRHGASRRKKTARRGRARPRPARPARSRIPAAPPPPAARPPEPTETASQSNPPVVDSNQSAAPAPGQPTETSRPAIDREPIDRIVLMMVDGASAETVSRYCRASGLGEAVVAEARRRIALASRYNPAQELGAAIKRLNSLYRAALEAGEYSVALQSQRELNKLLRLADVSDTDETIASDVALQELESVRGHLLPLALTDAGKPLTEHARLAADRIRNSV